MRDSQNVITYSRGFCGRPIQVRHFWLQWSYGRCHDDQILAEIGEKSHKFVVGVNFNTVRDVLPLLQSTLNSCKLINSNPTVAYEKKQQN